MSAVLTRDLLLQEVQTMPEALTQEVFDFLLFIKARHTEDRFLWQKVEETHTYRRQHPDKVVTVTAEEWDKATAHLAGEA